MTTTKNNEHKKLNFSSEREQSQACLNSAEHEKNHGRKVLNVPNLRFPEFQGEWEKCKLGDASEFSKERVNTQNLSSDNYVATENMLQDYQGIIEASSVPTNTNVIKFNKGDVLLSNIRPYLKKVWFADKNGGCSADVFVFKALSACIPDFLHYIIANDRFINFAMSGAKGVKMPRGDKEQMKTYEIGLPSIEEQKKIAKLLSLLDERIATQNKIIDKLQSLIKGIAQHCIRELINGWEYVRLGDICKITTGKLDANAQVENGQYPFFTCAERPFNIDSYAFDTEALLISGNGANLGYINYYKGKFNAYQRTYVLDHFSVNIQYVKWALKVLLPQRIAIEKSSSNTPYIVLSTLADLKIPIPNNSKQNHIADLMMSFERKLSTQLVLSDLYNKQKQYLLRQMFI